MTTKLQQLEIELAKSQAEAQTWEKAFKLMAHHGVPVNDEVLKKVRSKKTLAENFEEGEQYAEHFLKSNNIQEVEKNLTDVSDGSVVGVQNAVLAGIANWLREKAVETAVGYLTRLLKDNAINIVNWLLDKVDDYIVDGYMRLNEEDKFLFKNQLKEHPRFTDLLKKIEEKE